MTMAERRDEGMADRASDPAAGTGWVRRRTRLFRLMAGRIRRFGLVKTLLPRTLFARAMWIIVTPLVLTQLVAAIYFYDRHLDILNDRLTESVSGEIALVLDLYAGIDDPDAGQDLFNRASQHTGILFAFVPGEVLERPRTLPSTPVGFMEHELARRLSGRINEDRMEIIGQIAARWTQVRIQTADGVMDILVPRKRLFTTSSLFFLAFLVGSGAVLVTVALVFMRNQIRPIQRLAVAADRLGKGLDTEAIRPSGASEVRQAIRAFLVMRDRIRRQVAQRTETLAGVSHDLRTPLTRMRLGLSLLGDGPDVDELKTDVAEMEQMIDGYLAFARGEGVEDARTIDLVALLHDAALQTRREGAEVTVELSGLDEARRGDGRLPVQLPPRTMARCLANLLSNARRHAGRIVVRAGVEDDPTLYDGGTMILVHIDDDGPGISPGDRERVFRPFVRAVGDAAEAQADGAGLGLTIARDIARSRGGDIVLGRAPEGGLRATVTIPL